MRSRPEPYIARVLREQLKVARERRGKSQEDLAQLLGRRGPWIYRRESGQQAFQPSEVKQIVDKLEIDGAERSRLLGYAEETQRKRWWSTYEGISDQLDALLDIEQYAKRIIEWSPLGMPGLLQTQQYVRIALDWPDITEEEQQTRWLIRMGRQQALTRDQDPVELVAYIGEPEIHHALGGQRVLRGQLRHLQVQAELPNVTIRLVRLDDEKAHPSSAGAFYLYEPSEDLPAVVYHELPSVGTFLDPYDEAQPIQRIRRVVEDLDQLAYSPERSLKMIADKIKLLEE